MSITSTSLQRANIEFREASDALRPYVGCFWTISAELDASIRVVPDGTASISIALMNDRSSGWILRGPLVQPDERRFESPATLVGVRLRPGVAFILSEIAAEETVGRRIELKTITAFRDLVVADPGPRTPAEHIDALERFLVARLAGARVHDVVARALGEIERDRGCARAADVAMRCGVSPRHLHRLMCQWVGYGPKALARIVRFQTTLAEIEQRPAQSGAALASETGYFDQAHLTLDLARLAGETPRRLASERVADFSKTRCDVPLK